MATRRTHVRYPGGWKSAWGTAAFLVAYLVTFLWKGDQVWVAMERLTVEVGYYDPETVTIAEVAAEAGLSVPAWKGAGWLFYDAHLVGVVVPSPAGHFTAVNLVTGAGGSFLGLIAVVAVALAAAGFLTTVGTTDPVEFRFDFGSGAGRFAVNGALFALFGYLPPWLLGPFLFRIGPYGPTRGIVWAWMGLLYPLVFGALGGLLAGWATGYDSARRSRRTTRRDGWSE